MATKNHSDFERLLRVLFRKQKEAWRSKSQDSHTKRTLDSLNSSGQWCFIDDGILKNLPLKDDVQPTSFQQSKLIMPLPPMEKGGTFIPLMALEYQPSKNFGEACLRLKVLMIRQIENDLVGIGFRIESPERHCQQNPDEGIHDFYHAQLIKNIDYGPKIESPDWLPCSQPSFALWATDPIDAILNLILTLYGRKFYKEFLVSITPIRMSDEFGLLNARLK